MDISVLSVTGTMAISLLAIGITTVKLLHSNIASKPGAMATSPSYIRMHALRAAAIAATIMGVFELSKMVLYPDLRVWVSHLISILFAALLVSIASFSILKRQARLRLEIELRETVISCFSKRAWRVRTEQRWTALSWIAMSHFAGCLDIRHARK